MSDSEHDIRLRKLSFRCWHRGIKEMDLLLGHFSDAQMADLSPAELDEFEELIEVEDTSLYNWITGREPLPPQHDTPLFARIRKLDYLEGRLWFQKPKEQN